MRSYLSLCLLWAAFTSLPADLTHDVLKYTNEYRESKGLKALIMLNELNTIARKHSEDMASGRVGFGHNGFNQRYAVVQRNKKHFSSMGENVAYGARTGKDAVLGWERSTLHRRNMLGNYTYTGIGTASDSRGRIYYTQILVR